MSGEAERPPRYYYVLILPPVITHERHLAQRDVSSTDKSEQHQSHIVFLGGSFISLDICAPMILITR